MVTVFGAVASGSPEDSAKTASRLGVAAGVLGGIALTAIAASIVFALCALHVRYLSGRQPKVEGPHRGTQLWFYARIAEVEPDEFIKAAGAVTEAEEVKIRLTQVSVMAPVMKRRAFLVNSAYAAAGTGFVAIVATIVA